MGAKKKDKKKKPDEEDLSTKELLTLYKKGCKESEIPIYKPLEQKISLQLTENSHVNQILINEPNFGSNGVKAIFKAFKATK